MYVFVWRRCFSFWAISLHISSRISIFHSTPVFLAVLHSIFILKVSPSAFLTVLFYLVRRSSSWDWDKKTSTKIRPNARSSRLGSYFATDAFGIRLFPWHNRFFADKYTEFSTFFVINPHNVLLSSLHFHPGFAPFFLSVFFFSAAFDLTTYNERNAQFTARKSKQR